MKGSLLHTFEINDEQEDFTRPWLEQSPYADKIKFYIGDALERVPQLGITFDLVFVDGDKKVYGILRDVFGTSCRQEATLLLITRCGTGM